MVGGESTAIDSTAVPVFPFASVTCAVKLEAPGIMIATRFFGVLRFRFGNYPRTYVDLGLFEYPFDITVWIVAGRTTFAATAGAVVAVTNIALVSWTNARAISFPNSETL